MSYTVLARRYRSATFDEVIGQNHVAQTLKRAIQSDRIAHAYLFCGTRGVGKTSMARILAKALNCEKAKGPTTDPCGQCDSCQRIARGDDIDVIEIDAASNTGVDNIRDVIENAQYRPARSRFKIYIIDEVHMLSKSAFNALLKTLEEPPSHVKFILATTEPEKVLPTIISRCQRYDFRNIPTREIAGHLQNICQQERINADEDALLLVAKAGAGSMRDSLSLLDRLLSIGETKLTIDMVEQLLGLPKSQLMFDLSQAIGEGNVQSVLTQVDSLIVNGLAAESLASSLIDHFRNLLILRTCGKDSKLVEVPGLSLNDLANQANRFDPVALTQDIAILEELRRLMRTSQAGRALLDATMVRMTLADQFAAIADLMNAPATGSPQAPVQKKKFEPVAAPTLSVATPPPAPAAPPAISASSSAASAQSNGSVPPPAAPAVSEEAAPPPARVDADEDDDLPRPGKVWSGPSLKELLQQQTAASSKPPAPAPPPPPKDDSLSNVEPVSLSNLPAIWKQLLDALSAHGPALQALLYYGKLVEINDDQAVIRYSRAHETFPKRLDHNGKKEIVRDVLSKIVGHPVGVRFEVDATDDAPPPPPPTAPASKVGQASRPAPAAEPAAAPAPAGPPPVRMTAELRAELEKDPLIRALMEQLGANIIKVE